MTGPLPSKEDWPVRPPTSSEADVKYAWPGSGITGSEFVVTGAVASPMMALASNEAQFSVVSGPADEEAGKLQTTVQIAKAASKDFDDVPVDRLRSRRLRRRARCIVQSTMFKTTAMISLLIALLGNPIVELFDIPDEPCNTVVNILMLIALVVFALEIVLNYVSNPLEYNLCAFFFWMDVLGTASMVFEISWLGLSAVGKPINEASSSSFDTVWLRTARFAKVGARVGRLHRGLKTFWTVVMQPGKGTRPDQQEMRKVSHQLMVSLSTKVSILTITFVFLLPLFNVFDFPVDDLSGRAWIYRLEADYSRASEEARNDYKSSSPLFRQTVKEMKDFYAKHNYAPWKLEGFPSNVQLGDVVLHIPGEFKNDQPNRLQDVERISVKGCHWERPGCKEDKTASVSFDIGVPHRIEAGLDIAMFGFIVVVMVALSYNIQRSVNERVVEPLERMIAKVRDVASRFLKISVDNEQQSKGLDDVFIDDQMSETDLLEAVIAKLTKLTEIMVKEHVATDEEMADMDHTTLGVLSTILRLPVGSSQRTSFRRNSRSHLGSRELAVTDMPLSPEVLESWNLDVLELDSDHLSRLVLYVFFDSDIGNLTGRSFTDLKVFKEFHQQAKNAYLDNRYHCYQHACDILHTMYRILTLTSANMWLREHELYALLVAAFCHDLGHFGLTNQFLVETKADLAIGYNDNSPLENMHCATLFKICNNEGCNVFAKLEPDLQKEVRKVCISTILHTDNAHHLEMCKQIEAFGVRMSDTCDEAAAAIADGSELPEAYKQDVLLAKTDVWMNLFLHFCDVSNPLKPFDVCYKWAWRVLDEFFLQGDEEKRLGLPVGMLNDRDKVNKPGSQHGFINFLVAPLVRDTVKLFPPLHELTSQMASNLQQWRNLWAAGVNPTPTAAEIAQRDSEIAKWREVASQLQGRLAPRRRSV